MSILASDSRSVPTSCPNVADFPQPANSGNISAIADHLAWLNDDDSNDLTSYPGPSWDAPRYEPDPLAEAEESGYRLGFSLDYTAEPPASLDLIARAVWVIGKAHGLMDRHRQDADRRAFEDDLAESAFRSMDRHPDEEVRALGCIAQRSGPAL